MSKPDGFTSVSSFIALCWVWWVVSPLNSDTMPTANQDSVTWLQNLLIITERRGKRITLMQYKVMYLQHWCVPFQCCTHILLGLHGKSGHIFVQGWHGSRACRNILWVGTPLPFKPHTQCLRRQKEFEQAIKVVKFQRISWLPTKWTQMHGHS